MSSASSSGNIWCCPCCPAASRRLMLAVGQRVGPMTGDRIRKVGQPRQEGRRRRNDEPCALGSTLAHGVASPPTLPHMPDPPCRAQREASIAAALEREGFSHFRYSTAVLQHIAAVEPSQEAVLATCRQQVQEEKAARERRQGMIAWIAAQQMPSSYQYIMAVLQYERGQCTEAEAQEACRQQQVQDQGRASGGRRSASCWRQKACQLTMPLQCQHCSSMCGREQGTSRECWLLHERSMLRTSGVRPWWQPSRQRGWPPTFIRSPQPRRISGQDRAARRQHWPPAAPSTSGLCRLLRVAARWWPCYPMRHASATTTVSGQRRGHQGWHKQQYNTGNWHRLALYSMVCAT